MTRSRFGLIGVAVLAAAGVITFCVVMLANAATNPGPAPIDKAAVSNLVTTWIGSFPMCTGELETSTSMSTAAKDAMNADRRNVAQQVGTQEFYQAQADLDIAEFVEYERRETPNCIWTKHDVQVLDVQTKSVLKNGDTVLWVKIWEGWENQVVDPATGQVKETNKIDYTPTHEVIVRSGADGLRIVSIHLHIGESADGDLKQYGPTSPHIDEPIQTSEQL